MVDIRGRTVRAYAKQNGNEFDDDLCGFDPEGEPLCLGFNAETLAVALRTIAADMGEVRLELSGPTSLARVKVDGGVYVAMPLQGVDAPPERHTDVEVHIEPEPAVVLSESLESASAPVAAAAPTPESAPTPAPTTEADEIPTATGEVEDAPDEAPGAEVQAAPEPEVPAPIETAAEPETDLPESPADTEAL